MRLLLHPTQVFAPNSSFLVVLAYFPPLQMILIHLFCTLKKEIRGKTNIKQRKYINNAKTRKLED